jgi:hypothetical protein
MLKRPICEYCRKLTGKSTKDQFLSSADQFLSSTGQSSFSWISWSRSLSLQCQFPPSTGQSPSSTGQSISLHGSTPTNSVSTEQILSSDDAATIDNNKSVILNSEDCNSDILKKLSELRQKDLKRPLIAHLNINSLKSN